MKFHRSMVEFQVQGWPPPRGRNQARRCPNTYSVHTICTGRSGLRTARPSPPMSDQLRRFDVRIVAPSQRAGAPPWVECNLTGLSFADFHRVRRCDADLYGLLLHTDCRWSGRFFEQEFGLPLIGAKTDDEAVREAGRSVPISIEIDEVTIGQAVDVPYQSAILLEDVNSRPTAHCRRVIPEKLSIRQATDTSRFCLLDRF